jgi:hypothetical protein
MRDAFSLLEEVSVSKTGFAIDRSQLALGQPRSRHYRNDLRLGQNKCPMQVAANIGKNLREDKLAVNTMVFSKKF